MRVLVVGENCQDQFIYGDIDRLSPEAPVPVFVPEYTAVNDGMARNVANNVESLGMTINTITNNEPGNDIIKKRYVDKRSGQMVLRVDEHDYCEPIDNVLLSTIQGNECHIQMSGKVEVDAIIISDYCKGFLSEDDIKFICDNNKNVFVDTKKHLGSWIENADFIKINEFEYKKNHEFLKGNEHKLIVTMGSKGCMWNNTVFPAGKVKIAEVSGAGDTFIAGLVCGYLNTNDIRKAIEYAQKCTEIVVQERGVTTVDKENIK